MTHVQAHYPFTCERDDCPVRCPKVQFKVYIRAGLGIVEKNLAMGTDLAFFTTYLEKAEVWTLLDEIEDM